MGERNFEEDMAQFSALVLLLLVVQVNSESTEESPVRVDPDVQRAGDAYQQLEVPQSTFVEMLPPQAADEELPSYLQEMKSEVQDSNKKLRAAKEALREAKKHADVQPMVAFSGKADIVPDAMMEEDTHASALAGAKADYSAAMSHMAKLSKEMGQAAKVYDKRARQNAVAEKSAARTEREQLVAAAVVPALAMQVGNSMHAPGKTWDTSDTDDSMVKVSEVLKHKEVQKLVADIQRKHQAAKGPFGSLKSLQADDKQDEANEATSMTHWNALVNGWTPRQGENLEQFDKVGHDADSVYEAKQIESNLEKSGHKLSKLQKNEILEATKVHDANNRQIEAARIRLKQMQNLVEEDDAQAKKQLATAQAEEIVDEGEAMQSRVNAALIEPKMALNELKMVPSMSSTPSKAQASMIASYQDVLQKAAAYKAAKKAEEEVEQMDPAEMEGLVQENE